MKPFTLYPKPDSYSAIMYRYTVVRPDGIHHVGSCLTYNKAVEIAKAIGGTVRDIRKVGMPIIFHGASK
jgi:hypothetical protein